jgi:hypothetical protein
MRTQRPCCDQRHHIRWELLPLITVLLCIPPRDETCAQTARGISAVRTSVPPRIDGLLSDSCWSNAQPSSEFTQFDPTEGAPPTEQTSVRLLYDDNALFVGVMCNDSEPAKIVTQLSRRDRTTEADRFTVMIDSYFDRQTSFVFSANVAGVQSDGVLSQAGSVYDVTWDAVWEVRTARGRWGWSAEFAIPWSALRFSDRRDGMYEWGINFRRYISRKKEILEWVMVPRTERYSIPFWGTVKGIRDIRAPLHLEIAPYVSGLQTSTTGEFYRPIQSTKRLDAGLDFKFGLARNFTLDATFNPDFGQVEVDASVLNLTVFETLYPEKRPFFLEGAQMFTFGGSGDNTPLTLFFSRRIGRQPSGSNGVFAPAGGVVEDNPLVTTILGAAKLTGRTSSGLSVAALTSFTDEEHASLWSPTGSTTQVTEPRSSYNVVRLKQDMDDGSWYGGMVTMADRDAHPAWSGGIDWNQRFGRSKWTTDGYLAGSHSFADGELQTGAAGRVLFMCVSAEHWFPAISYDFYTPKFEINDLGFFAQPHDHGGYFQMLYRENESNGLFKRYAFSFNPEMRWNWDDGVATHADLRLEAAGEFRNFWQMNFLYIHKFAAYDDHERGVLGLYRRPVSNNATLSVTSPENHNVTATALVGCSFGAKRERNFTLNPSFTLRPTPWMEFSPALYYYRSFNAIAWVYPDGNTLVPGSSVFGTRDLEYLDLSLRGIVTFTRTLSIQFFLQSFIARGKYRDYAVLREDGRLAQLMFSASGSGTLNHDFNENIFNANVLLRWEYLPGSTLYLVWTQERYGYLGEYDRSVSKRMGDTWSLPRQDTFVLKANYWFSL